MSTEQNCIEVVRQLFSRVWNVGDIEAIAELVDDNYVGHATPHEMTLHGREQFEARVGLYRTMFPELSFEIEDQFSSADRVCTRWQAQLESDPETAKRDSVTGEPIRLGGITISRVENGRVVEEWDTWDTLALAESSSDAKILEALTLKL